MWYHGTINNIKWSAKVYDEPSEFGINSGRISKLWIAIDGVAICNYDRGWDLKPSSRDAKRAYKAVVDAIKKAV